MGQSATATYAAAKDALIKSNEEELQKAWGKSQSTMNLLRSRMYMGQHMMKRLELFPIIPMPQRLPTKNEVETLPR